MEAKKIKAQLASRPRVKIIVDYSHVHRPVTGIERVALDLFASQAMRGLDVEYARASSTFGMIMAQWLTLPWRVLADRNLRVICPGFPPSLPLTLLARDRVTTYIHDLFLLTRTEDLNLRAKYYMRPSFAFAVRHGRSFLVNSLTTKAELEKFCSPEAHIRLLRPEVGNVFGLDPNAPRVAPETLKLIAVGTLEPRKNYPYAAAIRRELEKLSGKRVELHIAGRAGWGEEAAALAKDEKILLHGYCTAEQVRNLIASADVCLCTSKEEGLGLPLLEAQHGGILVAATDIPVFREVLGNSGCLLPLGDAPKAAAALAAILTQPGAREKYRALSLANVARWNALAAADRQAFLDAIRAENAARAVGFFHQNEVTGAQGGVERYLSTLLQEGDGRCFLVAEKTAASGNSHFGVSFAGPKKLPRWMRFVVGVWENIAPIRAWLRANNIVALELSRPEYVLFAPFFEGRKTFAMHGTGPRAGEIGKFIPHYLSCLMLPLFADRIRIIGRDASGLPWLVRKLMRSRIVFADAWYDDCFKPAPFPDLRGPIKIFYAGRLDAMKNPDLIFAVAQAFAQDADLKAEFFYFGADGAKIPPHLRGAVIRDKGLLAAPQLARAISGCHIGILCSGYGEGSPFIVVETLACGRGYILPPLPGLIDAYRAQPGISFVPDYAVESYVAAVKELATRMRCGELTYDAIAKSVASRMRSTMVRAIIENLLA